MNRIFILILILYSSLLQAQTLKIIPAAERVPEYISLLKNKKVALVGNQTSMIGNVHILDSLIHSGINVKKVFSPEHGFRGNIEAGEKVKTTVDASTKTPIISLYGKHYKPKTSELADIDIVVFDIQDVGVRFYTYLSTLHYVMVACAESGKTMILLDRPNPNGFFIDGPVLDLKYKSFVGLHPVPIVYGMTIGEYALMINGEHWLKNGVQCELTVIKCKNYEHSSRYKLPVRPSPNLPNMQAIYLYHSLALFEGTCISVGRGTPFPFQVYGHPQMKNCTFKFTPKDSTGKAELLYNKQICCGENLQNFNINFSDPFTLKWLISAYNNTAQEIEFFNNFFYNLSGNGQLITEIKKGTDEKIIKENWKPEIDKFKIIRQKYLLYK
jgi:uncharacterized protein YbbC (DUF1343 family)